jgi:N-acetylglucosamine kinase-like BadF-type ATPase
MSILGQQQPHAAGEGYAPDAVVLAIDGGGSKTDVVALTVDGALVSRSRGAGSNPDTLGLEHSISVIRGAAEGALESSGGRQLIQTSIYLSGMDLLGQIDAFSAAISDERWAQGIADPSAIVDNDLFALLRAGTSELDAVAVVCGTGMNAVGVRSDGTTARFPALGMISGDWGGGQFLGAQALWHAARSEDGRGPKSLLEQLVPQAYGLSSVIEVIEGLHLKRIPARSVGHLAPVLFAAASLGDAVAESQVDRQAQEIVIMAVTALRRLELQHSNVPVILGGGVLASNDSRLMSGIASGMEQQAPHARIQLVTVPPILGAGLLALESIGADTEAVSRAERNLREALDQGLGFVYEAGF